MSRKKRNRKQKTISINTDRTAMPVSRVSKISKELKAAMQHHQAGQLQHAEHIYRQVLAVDPNNADANHLLGVLAGQVGQNDVAIDLIRKAIKSKPDYAEAHYNLGNVLMEQGYLEEAAAGYRKALAIKPNYAEAHYNLGNMLIEQGRLEEAAAGYRKALAIKPDYAEAHSNLGNVLKSQGRLEEATAGYRKALAIKPDYAEAHNNLGTVLMEQGHLEEAAASYRKAIIIKPDYVEAHSSLGNVLIAQGCLEEAAAGYRKAIIIKPDFAEAHNNLGTVLMERGRLEEAAASYRKAITIKPNFAEAYNNLGNVLMEQGRLEEAAAGYRKALAIKPDYAEAHSNLGNVLKAQGLLEEAAAGYRKALAIKPDYAEAHSNLGNVLKSQGRLEEAAAGYRKALAIKPDYAVAHNNLSTVLRAQGRLEEAAAGYRKALAIVPDYAEAHSNLGNVLKAQERLEDAAASYRKAITIKPDFAEPHYNLGNVLKAQGHLEEAAAGYRKALVIKPDFVEAHSNLLLLLNCFPNISREDIYNESLKWDQQHAKKIPRKEPVYANKKEKERKLRIGYISPDFRTHSVHYFFEPLLKAHNKENVEVYCYSNVMAPDNVTERLKTESDNWFSIVGKNDEDVAEQISRDGIDILVDLAGHTAKNRLLVFAYKPAPIQVTWLGYPNTTGMSAIDYRFTDEVADPIGEADNLHSEELIRLESGFLCYSGDKSAPEISALPCLERGHITFGSFNNIAKITPEVVKLWSDILRAAPDTHLLLKSKQLMDEGMRARCRGMLENEGVSGDRLELSGWLPKKEDHLGLYSKIDIGLDPFPYNGTTTTYEALWMGIPVITLEGDRHAARVGTSIMTHLNLPQLIADTKENYIKKAVELAGDRKRLAVYRKELRSILQSSKSCDEHHFAKKIETAFREMWRTWCQSDPVFPVTVPGEDQSPLESTTPPKLSSPANNAVELNIRGEELFTQGKLQEAEEMFEKVNFGIFFALYCE